MIQVIEDIPYHSYKGIMSQCLYDATHGQAKLHWDPSVLTFQQLCTLILHIHGQFKTELVPYHITNLIFWIMILFQLYMYLVD